MFWTFIIDIRFFEQYIINSEAAAPGYTSCGGSWYAPSAAGNPLATFEVNFYYFGSAPTYYWDKAFKACIDLGSGSKLAVIETNAEFTWILGMYTAFFPTIGGLDVDATRARYGSNYMVPAWRGGTSLSSGVGSVFTGQSVTPEYTGCFGSLPHYYHAFYLNSSGYITDIFERFTITNGGYLCKKFKTASYPSTVGYNLAYCFPSLGSAGACPTGWTSFNPGSQSFCYYPLSHILYKSRRDLSTMSRVGRRSHVYREHCWNQYDEQ